MKIKQMVSILMIFATTIFLISCGKKDDKIQIGILQFVQAQALDDAREGFIKSLADAGFVDGENITITVENPNASSDVMTQQAKKLVRESDLVLGIATPAAQALANEADQQNINIPILFTAVTDPVDAGLLEDPNNPGGNITGTNDLNPIAEQIALALELLPDAKTIGMLYTSSESNSKIQVDAAKLVAEELGLTVQVSTITTVNNLQQTARNLVNQVDIIYIPTDNIIASAIDQLDSILSEAKVPAIVGEDNLVAPIPALTIGINYFNLGVKTGEQAALILNKEKTAGEIPSVGLENFDLVINVEKLEAIGIEIPESLLNRAKAE